MSDLAGWVQERTGHRPNDIDLFERAFTHSSRSADHYERLEFLGDRVLGLVMAHWLVEAYPDEPEGKLAHRLNALVNGSVCAGIARELGVPSQLRLGKQAQDDGVFQSDNVLGDVVEALIGALYLDAGFDAATGFIRRLWADRVERLVRPPKHPKAELQEWAAAARRCAPEYRLLDTSGPDHAPRFRVSVAIKGLGEAVGEGSSKQEAEKEAAVKMLEQLK